MREMRPFWPKMVCFAVMLGMCVTGGAPAGAGEGRWRLAWSDEFEGPEGAAPDPSKWNIETGGHGWGNDELEFYTDRRENSRLDGKGALIIEARRENREGRKFTSARLNTAGKFSCKYGRIEARIRVPAGKGFWPAFWMLGNSADSAGWPACGEIDIMEYVGKEPLEAYGTLHGPCYSGGDGLMATCRLPGGGRFADDFHVYGVEWGPQGVKWFMDGGEYGSYSPSDVGDRVWAFDAPFYIILNLAVGGRWPGPPDGTTRFPQSLLVDWVRVYEDRAGVPERAEVRKVPAALPVIPPIVLPGPVEIEYFDAGGEGVGYHDADPENQGCGFRTSEGVDIARGQGGEGWTVGWMGAGEWLRYSVTVKEAGRYRLSARVASKGPGGRWHLEVDGKKATGSLKIPHTGDWHMWKTVTCGNLDLKAGKSVLKLVMESNGPSDAVGNFDRMELVRD